MVTSCRDYIHEQSLRPNVLLHLFNLWDNGLVNSGDISKVMSALDSKKKKKNKKNNGKIGKKGRKGEKEGEEEGEEEGGEEGEGGMGGRAKDPLGMNQVDESMKKMRERYPSVSLPSLWEGGKRNGFQNNVVEEVVVGRKNGKNPKKSKKRRGGGSTQSGSSESSSSSFSLSLRGSSGKKRGRSGR